jgi:hypothetical protein
MVKTCISHRLLDMKFLSSHFFTSEREWASCNLTGDSVLTSSRADSTENDPFVVNHILFAQPRT